MVDRDEFVWRLCSELGAYSSDAYLTGMRALEIAGYRRDGAAVDLYDAASKYVIGGEAYGFAPGVLDRVMALNGEHHEVFRIAGAIGVAAGLAGLLGGPLIARMPALRPRRAFYVLAACIAVFDGAVMRERVFELAGERGARLLFEVGHVFDAYGHIVWRGDAVIDMLRELYEPARGWRYAADESRGDWFLNVLACCVWRGVTLTQSLVAGGKGDGSTV